MASTADKPRVRDLVKSKHRHTGILVFKRWGLPRGRWICAYVRGGAVIHWGIWFDFEDAWVDARAVRAAARRIEGAKA